MAAPLMHNVDVSARDRISREHGRKVAHPIEVRPRFAPLTLGVGPMNEMRTSARNAVRVSASTLASRMQARTSGATRWRRKLCISMSERAN